MQRCSGLILLAFLTFSAAQAQEIVRTGMGVMGGSSITQGVRVQVIAGQPYASIPAYTSNGILRPGFIQPPAVLGLQTTESLVALNMAPNPSPGHWVISFEFQKGDRIIAYDAKGSLVLDLTVQEDADRYSDEHRSWPSGTYTFAIVRRQTMLGWAKWIKL
jgi:hypothetical protein